MHVYAAGYPQDQQADPPQIVIYKSEGPANNPPKYPNDTCKGYGIRYVMPTRVGMSGGGIWSVKGKLVVSMDGGNRLAVTRFLPKEVLVQASLSYWKREKNPYDMKFSRLLSDTLNPKQSKRTDVKGLISRARALVNLSLTQNRETFLVQVDGIVDLLVKAEEADSRQPYIPAAIAQIYIRQYEETGSKDRDLLRRAFDKINQSIKLSERFDRGYDGKVNLIRAYIFAEFGKYNKAIVDVDRRLKVVPNDVAALKDKARYSAKANDLKLLTMHWFLPRIYSLMTSAYLLILFNSS